ncbi:MAG: mycofactocin-coupled SDR family oxidoreductase [Pseudonocardiaceae bacterium]|nr:mycofactocin-coupled SDR family oxidoreductase [Pseudonocardiaceae bacterium]
MGRVEGKVALITGAARGQGRAHALRLAEEGADIIAVDLCGQLESVPYAMATEADLAQTAQQVEDLDRRILTAQADVRDLGLLQSTVSDGVSEFGRLDIVCANAGIASFAPTWELSEESWQEMIDVNLTGVWKTIKAAVPRLLEQGEGGSIILTSSIAGLIAFPNLAHYTAAKHGVTGLMRTLAVELAPYRIRVNSVHPTTVDTDMVNNDEIYSLFLGGVEGATRADAEVGMKALNGIPIPWVDPIDISNAVLYLASEESRYVTGTTQVIDAGAMAPFKIPHE